LLLIAVWPQWAFAQLDELENPGTVSAVQERRFRMSHELTLSGGVLPLDAFYKSVFAQVGYTYHFSDHFAWQVGRGAYGYNLYTGLREQLEREYDVRPTRFQEAQWFVGSDLMWSPMYGKASWMNRSVIHFEFYGLLGASIFKLNTGFRPGVNAGVGGRLFTSKNVSFRLDLTNNFVIVDKLLNIPTIQLGAALNFGGAE
jgi:outer membrane beta-barrel protein